MATQITSANNNIIQKGARVVVRNSVDSIYAILVDDSDDKVEVWKSVDGGSNFTQQDAVNSPAGADSQGVAAAIDSQDIIHIVWWNNNGAVLRYIPFPTTGGSADTFGVAENASTATRPSVGYEYVAVAIDSNDKPHVAFDGAAKKKGVTYDTVYYTNKTGAAWLVAPIQVEGAANERNCHFVDIAINDSDIPVIAYLNDDDDDAAPALGNQNDANAFTLKDVDQTAKSDSKMTIAVDSNGDVWIGYIDADDSVAIAKQSANWTDPWTIADSGITGQDPSLAIDGTDKYIFYEDPADDNIKYNKYTTSWAGETELESGTYLDVKAKWANLNDNGGSTQIDFLFSNGTHIFWDKLSFAPPPPPPAPFIPRPGSVRLHGPLFSLSAQGWLGGYTYHHRYWCQNPYPFSFLPTIFRTYTMPAFGLHPYPQFISQYYSTAGWIYQRRRTWHGILWIAYPGLPMKWTATAGQIARRTKFAAAVAAWQALTGLQKGVWNSYNYPIHASGYNRFIRAYMKDLPH